MRAFCSSSVPPNPPSDCRWAKVLDACLPSEASHVVTLFGKPDGVADAESFFVSGHSGHSSASAKAAPCGAAGGGTTAGAVVDLSSSTPHKMEGPKRKRSPATAAQHSSSFPTIRLANALNDGRSYTMTGNCRQKKEVSTKICGGGRARSRAGAGRGRRRPVGELSKARPNPK